MWTFKSGKKALLSIVLCSFLGLLTMGATAENTGGCGNTAPSADDKERTLQEAMLKEATAQIGMPAIVNFREKKLLKEIFERRDQGLVTYTYAYSEMMGCFTFVGETVGYPIPYTTQYTNPQKFERVGLSGGGYSYQTLPQADPNALFSPGSADATWSLMKDPAGKALGPIYSEPKLFASPFKMRDEVICENTMKRFADILAAALKK